jgi:hypothetical protein
MNKAQHAILRFAKYKGPTVSRIEAHNERTKETYASNPDIKTELSKHNFHPVVPDGKYRDISNRIIREAGCRVRKDSVTAVEVLITASPEFFEKKSPKEVKEFFEYAVEFMRSKQNPDTYISAVVHVDEKTPHMHLCFVPITVDGRLSAKEIIGNKKRLTQWQDEFWSYMVKKYPDFERGESASLTGRTHIPPRLFKQAARLTRQKDKLMELISEMNALNAKAKSKEIAALLDEYIPGVEELMTKLKKTSKAAKEMRSEIADLKKAVDRNKASALRQLELEKKVQELDDLQHMVEALQQTMDAIPAEIIAFYNEPKLNRKELIAIE